MTEASEQPVTRKLLGQAVLDQVKPIDRIEMREITLQPGVAGGLHVHNGPVVGNVVRGSVVYQIDGQAENVLRAGDVFYEPEGARIARFDAQEDGVTFIAFFPLSPGDDAELTML
jgi:quercetin dioxygenase-like cupin family protein